jgi:hypothetical protein
MLKALSGGSLDYATIGQVPFERCSKYRGNPDISFQEKRTSGSSLGSRMLFPRRFCCTGRLGRFFHGFLERASTNPLDAQIKRAPVTVQSGKALSSN